jgi:hypothetical protein
MKYKPFSITLPDFLAVLRNRSFKEVLKLLDRQYPPAYLRYPTLCGSYRDQGDRRISGDR